jgi:hypothetical protein
MKINLKKTQYNSQFEGLFLTTVGTVACGIIFYGILTNTLNKSDNFIITAFSFFAIALLLGIWKLINKKSSEYIDINGWKYKLFLKVNKTQFILISGGINALGYIVIFFLLSFLGFISLTEITVQFILLMIAMTIILTLISGYIEYKKYSLVDLNSEFDGISKS